MSNGLGATCDAAEVRRETAAPFRQAIRCSPGQHAKNSEGLGIRLTCALVGGGTREGMSGALAPGISLTDRSAGVTAGRTHRPRRVAGQLCRPGGCRPPSPRGASIVKSSATSVTGRSGTGNAPHRINEALRGMVSPARHRGQAQSPPTLDRPQHTSSASPGSPSGSGHGFRLAGQLPRIPKGMVQLLHCLPGAQAVRGGTPGRRWRGVALLLAQAGLVWLVMRNVWLFLHHHRHQADALDPLHPWAGQPFSCRTSSCPLLVAGVAADTGAWNTIQPVLLTALDSEPPATVALHFSGACARLFRQGKLRSPDERIHIFLAPGAGSHDTWVELDLTSFLQHPHDITVVGASASAEGTEGGAAALCQTRASQTIALLEDRYATSIQTLQAFQEGCPLRASNLERAKCMTSGQPCLFVAVADSIAEQQVLRQSSYKGALTISGSPHFDGEIQRQKAAASRGTNWLAKERAEVRDRLGIGEQDFVVFIAGQPVGDDEVMALVAGALEELRPEERVWVLHRSHPRQAEQELQLLQAQQAKAPQEWFGVSKTALQGFQSSEEIIYGADVVISGYSSTNYYAMLAGIVGVVYADVPRLRAKFQKDKKMHVVPEVAARAGWSVSDPGVLAHVMRELRKPKSPEIEEMRSRQRELVQFHDGHAAARVWSLLQKWQGTQKEEQIPKPGMQEEQRGV